MSTIKCLIVDDEPIAREIIESYIKNINFLELVTSCEDPFEALKILENSHIDLLISDIQMPRVNGLELVRSLPSPPLIIFITGYESFAVNSFELGVVDYLLKPVSFDRFLKAINKARLQIANERETFSQKNKSSDCIFIKVNDRLNKIEYRDILYIEASGDFLKIHTTSTSSHFLTYSTIKGILEKLPANYFVRIHNSYIVAVNSIKSLIGNEVELVGGTLLPISKSHKDQLLNVLNINN
ncbi:MAG TPA: LytTR family DNA-binding domain-containing protein [Hanamia sp.]|nr:LytTR family DNA-binding domain-containing protein [Hanamia sp.]